MYSHRVWCEGVRTENSRDEGCVNNIMKILHTISGDFLAGSETYAITLAEWQNSKGHYTAICGLALHKPTEVAFFSVPIHDRTFLTRIINVIKVLHLIKKHKFDMVHSHSRAASWISHFACKLSGRPHIATLHGRLHIHPSSRHKNIYGSLAIAVCENIAEHAQRETRYFSEENLIVIRNPV